MSGIISTASAGARIAASARTRIAASAILAEGRPREGKRRKAGEKKLEEQTPIKRTHRDLPTQYAPGPSRRRAGCRLPSTSARAGLQPLAQPAAQHSRSADLDGHASAALDHR